MQGHVIAETHRRGGLSLANKEGGGSRDLPDAALLFGQTHKNPHSEVRNYGNIATPKQAVRMGSSDELLMVVEQDMNQLLSTNGTAASLRRGSASEEAVQGMTSQPHAGLGMQPQDEMTAEPECLSSSSITLDAKLSLASAGDEDIDFIPLGLWSGGERIIVCDPSGAPHQPLLLPIPAIWRELFGARRPLPLWLGFTPGAIFAISSEAARAHTREFYERGLQRCGLSIGPDPIAGHAFERLWRYIFDPSLLM